MAQATIELRRLLGMKDFKLFDFDYQFDDLTFKKQLEEMVTDFYYDYEIGFETPDMFKRKFKSKWKRIIPYYNELYNTTLLKYNPLITNKMEEYLDQLSTSSNEQISEFNGMVENSSYSSTDNDFMNKTKTNSNHTDETTSLDHSESKTESDGKVSDYPQQPIAGGDYLSGANISNSNTKIDNENTSESKGNNTIDSENEGTSETKNNSSSDVKTDNDNYSLDKGEQKTDYKKTIEGITGTSYQSLIRKERDNILRIQDMVIREMKTCFILVY